MFRFAPLTFLAAAPPIACRPVRRARPSFLSGYRHANQEWQREKPGGKAAQRRLRQRARILLAQETQP